jgi:hypothetical protein
MQRALLVLACLAPLAQAFYLPGVAPADFKRVSGARGRLRARGRSARRARRRRARGRGLGPADAPRDACPAPPAAPAPAPQKDLVLLKVNKLSSVKTQLPYEYYSLPYCRPEKIIPFAENLGEVLRGDRIENSLYQVGGRRGGAGAAEGRGGALRAGGGARCAAPPCCVAAPLRAAPARRGPRAAQGGCSVWGRGSGRGAGRARLPGGRRARPRQRPAACRPRLGPRPLFPPPDLDAQR